MWESDNSSPKKAQKKLSIIKIPNGKVTFKETWLNKVTENERVNITNQINEGIKQHGQQFKYLFSVPNIITDPKLVQRRKTFELFTKNANLELYYLQLKKATNIAKSISQNADYKSVISSIRNNRLQDKYLHQLQKSKGLVLTNELWSNKLLNQINDQSRLKELSEMLQLQKIQLNSEEQLLNFEKYFKLKQGEKKQSISELNSDLKKAFDCQTTLKDIQTIDELPTFDQSNKQSRLQSRNQTSIQNIKLDDQSFFTREIMTAQLSQKRQSCSELQEINRKISDILIQTKLESFEVKKTMDKVNNFEKQEIINMNKRKSTQIKKYQIEKLKEIVSYQKKR